MGSIKRLTSIIVSCLEKVNLALTMVSMLVIATLTGIVVYQVFMRYFFERPTSWVFELSKYAMLYIIFLPIGYAQQLGQHIRVDAIITRLPEKLRARMEIAALILSIFFVILLLWSATDYTLLALEHGWNSKGWGLGIPTFWVLIVMPIGLFVLLLNQLVALIRRIADLFSKRQDEINPEQAT